MKGVFPGSIEFLLPNILKCPIFFTIVGADFQFWDNYSRQKDKGSSHVPAFVHLSRLVLQLESDLSLTGNAVDWMLDRGFKS